MHVSWLVRSERTSIIPKKRGSQTRLPTRTPLLLDEQRPQDRQHNHGSNNHADGEDQEGFHRTRPIGSFEQLNLTAFNNWCASGEVVHIVHDISVRTWHPTHFVRPRSLLWRFAYVGSSASGSEWWDTTRNLRWAFLGFYTPMVVSHPLKSLNDCSPCAPINKRVYC